MLWTCLVRSTPFSLGETCGMLTDRKTLASCVPLQIEASIAIHKRTNPGYVEIPYVSTNTEAFKYIPAPDFSRHFLKKDSDCKFQKYAAEAILKHVDLKKTSH